MNDVNSILDGWFGEPVEHADNPGREKYLYRPLLQLYAKLEKENNRLREEISKIYYPRDAIDR